MNLSKHKLSSGNTLWKSQSVCQKDWLSNVAERRNNLLHLVGLTFTYLSKMHGHSNIKFMKSVKWQPNWSMRTDGQTGRL